MKKRKRKSPKSVYEMIKECDRLKPSGQKLDLQKLFKDCYWIKRRLARK